MSCLSPQFCLIASMRSLILSNPVKPPDSHFWAWLVPHGYCESFNSKLRDELLNREIFYSLKELRVLVERWRVHYNTVRPHSSLGYRSPAPAAWLTEASQGHGKVESKERFPLSHTPQLRRRGISITRRAALTISPVQKIGQTNFSCRADFCLNHARLCDRPIAECGDFIDADPSRNTVNSAHWLVT
jgi:Integrase core domain